jgi:diacylglycerol kinase family enzyme
VSDLRSEINDPTNPENKHVGYRQLAEFTIRSDRKMHCNLDGEPVLKKKFRFSVLPRHLSVVN